MAIEHAARMTKYVIEMLDAWKCVQVCKPGRLMCWLSFWHLTAACSWRDYDVIMTGFGLRWRVYDAIATRFGFWWRDCSLLISDFMPRCAFCCQGFSREHRWFSWQLNTCHMNDEVCNQDAECAQMRANAWVCFDWVCKPYLLRTHRARKENMAHGECVLSACHSSKREKQYYKHLA